ncbi:hypothetical protein D3C86_2121930 [compost metagenome]
MFLVLHGLLRSRQTRASCFHLQQMAARAFRPEIEGLESSSFRNLPKNNRTGAVAEQDAGVAVCVVGNP